MAEPEDEDHLCHWMREYALEASDHKHTRRQMVASDARNKQMARNCYSYENGKCTANDLNLCKMQCGNRNARRNNSELVFDG